MLTLMQCWLACSLLVLPLHAVRPSVSQSVSRIVESVRPHSLLPPCVVFPLLPFFLSLAPPFSSLLACNLPIRPSSIMTSHSDHWRASGCISVRGTILGAGRCTPYSTPPPFAAGNPRSANAQRPTPNAHRPPRVAATRTDTGAPRGPAQLQRERERFSPLPYPLAFAKALRPGTRPRGREDHHTNHSRRNDDLLPRVRATRRRCPRGAEPSCHGPATTSNERTDQTRGEQNRTGALGILDD